MFWETFAPQKSILHQGSIISSLTRSPCERICAGSFLGFTFNASNSAGFCAAQSFRFEKGSRPNEWDEFLTQNCKTIKGAAKRPKNNSQKKAFSKFPCNSYPLESQRLQWVASRAGACDGSPVAAVVTGWSPTCCKGPRSQGSWQMIFGHEKTSWNKEQGLQQTRNEL